MGDPAFEIGIGEELEPVIRVVAAHRAWRAIHDPHVVRLIDTVCTYERARAHAAELARELLRRGERAIRVRAERAGQVFEEFVVA